MSIKSELTVNGAITEVESNSFFIIKAIAIMSVITAHILVPINDEGIFIKAVKQCSPVCCMYFHFYNRLCYNSKN